MAEIVFTMELRGKGVPVEGRENTFHVETAGTGPAVRALGLSLRWC